MALLEWAVLAARQTTGDSQSLPSGTRAPTLYGFMGSFGPLALCAVVLRFYSRYRFARIGWDDITIAIGLVLYTGLIVATVFGKPPRPCGTRQVMSRLTGTAIRYGLGVHIWEVPQDTEVQMQKVGLMHTKADQHATEC
jgi:hypothetical protein